MISINVIEGPVGVGISSRNVKLIKADNCLIIVFPVLSYLSVKEKEQIALNSFNALEMGAGNRRGGRFRLYLWCIQWEGAKSCDGFLDKTK